MINEALLHYAKELSQPEPHLLQELHRDTFLKMRYPRMLSGHLQGRFLSMISKMIRPETILEIGTFTGYSAICLAEGLAPGGQLHTIEADPELESHIRQWVAKAGLEESIHLHIGEAIGIIPTLDPDLRIDLVFLDADKENYPEYYRLLRKRLLPGAFLIADNVLWDGKVVNVPSPGDKETLGIQQFNKLVHEDEGVENVILPIRDGVSLIRIVHPVKV